MPLLSAVILGEARALDPPLPHVWQACWDWDGILASAELYDPATGLWTEADSLDTPRMVHTATLLSNGQVLVAGGEGWGANPLPSAEVYDVATGLWTTTGSMNDARARHKAARLADGTVLVAGGGGYYVIHTSAELYDPVQGQWTVTGSLSEARHSYSATLIAGGRVLAVGGYNGISFLSSAELYTPENQPPTATADAYTTPEDTILDVAMPGVLLNDSDPDGDPLTAVLDSLPGSGALVLQADGSFTYTPAPEFAGPVTFSYHASDGANDSNIALVTITISPTHDAPEAAGDAYTGTDNMLLTVPAPGVLANDTDADGDPLSAALDRPPTSGMLDLDADGSFTYLPAVGFVGAFTFTYHADDGESGSNIAVVTITIAQAPHAPLAMDDAYTVLIDRPLLVPAPGVLANDSDDRGHPLTAVLDTPPVLGALSLSADGSFSYMPALDFTGVVTFTYHANDGIADSQPAAVTLTIKSSSLFLPPVVRGYP